MAARLGFDETTIRRLAARGHLRRLTVTEPQIHARLYRAHVAYLLARTQREEAPTVGLRKPDGQDQHELPRLLRGQQHERQLSVAGTTARSCQATRTSTLIGGATCDESLSP